MLRISAYVKIVLISLGAVCLITQVSLAEDERTDCTELQE